MSTLKQATNQPTSMFAWQRWPAAEALVARMTESALASNSFAERLAQRMATETSTRFADWVDHFVLEDRPGLAIELLELGWTQSDEAYAPDSAAFEHSGGLFPMLAVAPRRTTSSNEVREVGLKVESIAAFSSAHQLGLEIHGHPMAPYRFARLESPNSGTDVSVVERRGYRGFDPFPGEWTRKGLLSPHAARDALAARELWQKRRRTFEEDEEGIADSEATLDRVIDRAGSSDLACHLIFEVERDYWMRRNRAARVQYERQERLGLGWANHDHHTFRCSRRFFPRIIAMFERLGFTLREGFHAGEHAGWGAQVLEHPTTGVVIFADLDLAPDEAGADFSHRVLPELPRPNTVGLWVGLHGESILEAGMHHLEAQFNFDDLRRDLESEAGIATMKPFSDFPFLRQAFTQGERWTVDPRRADRLLREGWIDREQHAKFLAEGAIGSHLENLQRREGFKGFNQQAVSAIIAETDPRRH